MSKTASFLSLGMISLDRNHGLSLHRQLYRALREAILTGQLKPGIRLPSTRALAQDLGVSRNTISNAYDQLITEGYLESKVGSGTRVTRTLPEEILHVQGNRQSLTTDPLQSQAKPRLSERGTLIVQIPFLEKSKPRAFSPALPAMDAFPFKLWGKLSTESWQTLTADDFGYGSALGYRPLREAIATYLQTTRGVRCTPEQIIITNGAQQAISLSMTLLLNRGDQAWLENPSFNGVKAALRSASAQMIPVSVDSEGLDVDEALAKAPQARLAFISPSHQFPLGVTMSLSRRLKLLQWAQENEAWVLEDDYDSAIRYAAYPLAALQGLDTNGRVIYIGTFSKVLFPAIRIGYMVVPPNLIEPFRAARAHADRGSTLLGQVALAKFIADGHLARHIRRTRSLYAERQKVFIKMVQSHLADMLTVEANDTGLHLVGWLPEGTDDYRVSQTLQAHGIDAPALSSYAIDPLPYSGLVMGYTVTTPDEIIAAVKRMKPILNQSLTINHC